MKSLGKTIEDMDIETELKDHKMEFLELKLGLPDSKIIEEVEKLE